MQNSTCLLKKKPNKNLKKPNSEHNSVTMAFPSARTRESSDPQPTAERPARGRLKAGAPADSSGAGATVSVQAYSGTRLPTSGIRKSHWMSQRYRYNSDGCVLLSTRFQTLLLSAILAAQMLPSIQSETSDLL